MTKRAVTLPLVLAPPARGTRSARWLRDAVRREILEGRLRPGARLPSTRDVAREYGLSRGTVVSAFDQLKAEGYTRGRVGSGSFVRDTLPDDLLRVVRPTRQVPQLHAGRGGIAAFARRAHKFPAISSHAVRAFRTDQPALDLFPTTLWAQVAGRRLRRVTAELLRGCDPTGWRPLQLAVADYLTGSRGVRCNAEQVVIVSGVQDALDLVARVLLEPGDGVAMEDPGYPGAHALFQAAGATIQHERVDDEGIVVPQKRQRPVRLAYVTPGHQFPLGVCMSLGRRLALLEWARACGAHIFEDDYDSEYRYVGRPMPALQGLDRHGTVLFAGSFSKVLFPSLRIGYLVVPPALVDRFAATVSITRRHAPLLEQAVLRDFIVEGHFARHVRRMREVYAERQDALLTCVREQMHGVLEVTGVEAGLQTAAWLTTGANAESVARAAAARRVEVTPLSRFAQRASQREGLQLGFAAVDVREIRRACGELAVILEKGIAARVRG